MAPYQLINKTNETLIYYDSQGDATYILPAEVSKIDQQDYVYIGTKDGQYRAEIDLGYAKRYFPEVDVYRIPIGIESVSNDYGMMIFLGTNMYRPYVEYKYPNSQVVRSHESVREVEPRLDPENPDYSAPIGINLVGYAPFSTGSAISLAFSVFVFLLFWIILIFVIIIVVVLLKKYNVI